MADIKFVAAHNQVALLSAETDLDYAPICSYINQSHFHTALTINPPVFTELMLQFWTTCTEVIVDDDLALKAIVCSRPVFISPETIRTHLRLNDRDSPLTFDKSEVNRTFRLMGYEGDFNKSTFLKGKVSYNWRFLLHIVLHSLSNKSGGWDQVPHDLACLVHGLVRGIKFNYSQFVFDALRSNLRPPKFFMFPRFLQHILNCELGNLLTHEGNTMPIGQMKSSVFITLKKPSKGFSGVFKPLTKRMERVIEQPAPEHPAPGDNTAIPAAVEPTPAIITTHTQPPIRHTYKRKPKRTPAPSTQKEQAPKKKPRQVVVEVAPTQPEVQPTPIDLNISADVTQVSTEPTASALSPNVPSFSELLFQDDAAFFQKYYDPLSSPT